MTGRGEVRLGDLSVVEPGRTFDLVVAFEVLEHIEDDHAAARDWVARLRPGGSLVVSTPAYQHRYGPQRLRRSAARLSAWLDEGTDVYAYFNNDWYGNAVTDATTLRRQLEAPA